MHRAAETGVRPRHVRRGAPFDTCFALSASTCIVSRLCIDTLGLVCLRILDVSLIQLETVMTPRGERPL